MYVDIHMRRKLLANEDFEDVYKRQVLPWIEGRYYLRNKKLKMKSINTPGYKG